jgi:prepilin-type N-terminal cleavage/methylation domain-containing protein
MKPSRFLPASLRRQRGLTMMELVIAISLLGIISITLSPTFRTFLTARDRAYVERQVLINGKIAKAMLDYAEQSGTAGLLPSYYNNSTSKIFFGIANPASTTGLTPYLVQQGVPMRELNDDGRTGAKVRVWQKLSSGLTQTTQLYGQSGPPIDLSYEMAAVYMTDCGRTDTCNTTATSTTPPKGNKMTAVTWQPGAADVGPVVFSTLPLQRKMLEITSVRMERIREAMTSYVRAKTLSAAASDNTNWYPEPTDTSAYAGMLVQDPSANQGCRTVWFDLSAVNVDVLGKVGMSQDELGRTAWGAPIEYCRDYDPAGTGTTDSNKPPHYAALRIHRLVAAVTQPDSFDPTQNALISF